ncbi:cytochrome P450 [Microtetraspora sp. NBRC 13810]|uniref:cytochrome P450 n=1 Tax=Microtetraspora sp. NBRC 13810 TaxID=3030990 RepID=UPI0024A4856D|nr:cytochrome P450 [Microtetraspora sp. NBRC 13810]GLW13197.1 cytochrome P450 [Microtetraspora sp. NBRC 13810]
MSVQFSPFDYAIHEDPFPVYARLLEEAPLYRNDADDFWALSRHEDVAAALQDFARFSSSHGPLLDEVFWGPQASQSISFVAMDPPAHTPLRTLVSRGFTARRVAALEPRIREIARRHLEEALERGGAFDFIEGFAARMPLDVVSELVGVPESDRDDIRRLAAVSLTRQDGSQEVLQESIDAGAALTDYYARLIATRRQAPTDDMVSVLIEELSDQEIIPILFVLLAAGSETTTNLLGHAMYWAWRFPDQMAKGLGGAAAAWVEEGLRYDPPAVGVGRLLMEDIELYGTRVPAGARMWLSIGAANRDPRAFPDPDSFDLERDTSKLLSFGAGRHFCMGSTLGKLEARIALEELAAVVSGYEIDPDGVRRSHMGNVRGFATLPVVVKPR